MPVTSVPLCKVTHWYQVPLCHLDTGGWHQVPHKTKEEAVTGSTPALQDILCPGCHFECKLANYQCGRGKEFFDLAAAGGEVPIRRGPTRTPSEIAAGAGGRPPLNDCVMHWLNVVANRLQDNHEEAGMRKVVLTLTRTGSFMSLPILAKRMLLSVDDADAALIEAEQAGYVTIGSEDGRGRFAYLTDAGKQQSAVWEAERDVQTAAFVSNLDEDEKEVLERLLRKLLGMV